MLPSLHQLSIGVTRLNSPRRPPTSARRVDRHRTSGDEKSRKLSKLAPGSSTGGDEPNVCAVPKTEQVTQKQAKEWYDNATHENQIGEGAHGDTRSYICNTPIGNHVVIKRFTGTSPGDFFGARYNAKREADSHMQVWQNCSEECRKHLAKPAEMVFETDRSEGSYTVQALVYAPGLRTMAFTDLLMNNNHFALALDNDWNNWLHNLDYDEKFRFCANYGKMLGCIAEARAVHRDLHGGNVLCVTNFPKDLSGYRECIDGKKKLVLNWRVIDWGTAEVYDDQHQRKGDTICMGDDRDPLTWRSSFGYVRAADNTCIFDVTATEVAEELFELFFQSPQDCGDAVDRAGCVTVADVVHWVRELSLIHISEPTRPY